MPAGSGDLWAPARQAAVRRAEPLAVRMRPRSLDEVVGQRQLLSPGKLLRRMIDADAITSLILHGPPGTGKTTLAEVIATCTRRRFVRENAASVGVKRIREIIDEAERTLTDAGRRTILFLDEIHRFTKSQQDVLLADVERGLITLIGATTENPLFSVNAALISRSTLFRVEPLSEDEIVEVLKHAIADRERGYGQLPIDAHEEALRVWAVKSEGDARRALTALEVAVESSRSAHTGPIVIDAALAEDSIQAKVASYGDDGHYDAISAMIKSVRGSDPDAAVYWLARMLDAGEDPRFIARRLAILASEDIGNADPRAISLAQAAWDLVERIGMPEARITLSQCACYLACCPKSNASYRAIDKALEDVRAGRVLPVPMELRDPNSSPVAGADGKGLRTKQKAAGDGKRYEYSHDTPGGLTGQDYLGVERRYYEPGEQGMEKALGERLAEVRRLRRLRRRGERDDGPGADA
jgi:putative ATPase